MLFFCIHVSVNFYQTESFKFVLFIGISFSCQKVPSYAKNCIAQSVFCIISKLINVEVCPAVFRSGGVYLFDGKRVLVTYPFFDFWLVFAQQLLGHDDFCSFVVLKD